MRKRTIAFIVSLILILYYLINSGILSVNLNCDPDHLYFEINISNPFDEKVDVEATIPFETEGAYTIEIWSYTSGDEIPSGMSEGFARYDKARLFLILPRHIMHAGTNYSINGDVLHDLETKKTVIDIVITFGLDLISAKGQLFFVTVDLFLNLATGKGISDWIIEAAT